MSSRDVSRQDGVLGSPPPRQQARFEQLPDGWLRDTTTGLEWSPESLGPVEWGDCERACAEVGGRVPSIVELLSLVDYERCDPATELHNMAFDFYWSSTTYRNDPDVAWGVNFFHGGVDADGKGGAFRVRAVRGGLWGWKP